MSDEKIVLTIEEARAELLYRTNVLNDYKGATLTEIHRNPDLDQTRAIFAVKKGSTTIIFKSISCPVTNKDGMDQLREEYAISLRGSELSSGVAKPLKFEEISVKSIKRHVMEILYEYCGESLSKMLGIIDEKTAIKYMSAVSGIMASLEAGKILHADIKPENLVVKGNEVKVLDFGVSIKFNTASQMFQSKTSAGMIGGTTRYLPPEVLNETKAWAGRIDIYTWGMTLYQLLTKKNDLALEKEINIRLNRVSYPKFLENVKKIQIKSDPTLQKKIIEILLKVLSFDHKMRPTFEQIENELNDKEYYVETLKEIREKLSEALREKDKYKELYEKSLNKDDSTKYDGEYEDIKNKYASLTEEYGNNILLTLEKTQKDCADLKKMNDEYKNEIAELNVE